MSIRIVVLSLWLLFAELSSAESIVISSGEWPPFMSPHLQQGGVYSHTVKDAFLLEGITVDFQYFPWIRSYKEAVYGNVDASILWSKNPEREKEVLFSDPVGRFIDVFFFRKDRFIDWKSMSDLKEKQIGITTGYFYGEAFAKAVEDNVFNATNANTDVANFKRLLAGRIDAFPINLDVALTLLHDFSKKDRELLTYSKNVIRHSDMHLVVGKKAAGSAELIRRFNLGLKKLKETGAYQQYFINQEKGLYMPLKELDNVK